MSNGIIALPDESTTSAVTTILTSPSTESSFVIPVTNLEHETNGVCKNYKIEIQKRNGQNICPYKLEEGINTSHVAGDIMDDAMKKKKKN